MRPTAWSRSAASCWRAPCSGRPPPPRPCTCWRTTSSTCSASGGTSGTATPSTSRRAGQLRLGATTAGHAPRGRRTGLAFGDRVAAAAEAADHHPDSTPPYPAVHVKLTSHDAGGVTDRDTALAGTIRDIAAELGIAATP